MSGVKLNVVSHHFPLQLSIFKDSGGKVSGVCHALEAITPTIHSPLTTALTKTLLKTLLPKLSLSLMTAKP